MLPQPALGVALRKGFARRASRFRRASSTKAILLCAEAELGPSRRAPGRLDAARIRAGTLDTTAGPDQGMSKDGNEPALPIEKVETSDCEFDQIAESCLSQAGG